MATNLVLVRHGQTAWNKRERFRGRVDIPLDQTGHTQAELVARRLAGESPAAAVISSPLQRAAQTGRAIAAAQHIDLQTAEALVDIDFGRLSGLSPDEAQAQYPDIYSAWITAPHALLFPKGESLARVRARFADYLWPLATSYDGTRVIMVSHLAVCRVALCYLLQLPESAFWQFDLDTASVSELRLSRGQSVLLRLNDTSHLAST